MAAKRRVAKAGAAAYAAGQSKYVKRLLEDEELRANLYQALEAGRSAYARLTNGKSPTKVAFDDKRFQRDVQKAAASARDASIALREGPKRRRRGRGLFRLLLLALVGGGVAVGASEPLRKRVLDLLFGAEEEFEYTSTTTTPPPPPPAAPSTPGSTSTTS